MEQFEEKMKKSLNALSEEYATIRAGRANPHVLDKIMVDYYGTPSPLQTVANISVPEAMVSELGITPNNDGKIIRLVFPELTEDRRKELVKDVKKKGENAKVAIRNIRRDANDSIKKQNKANEISDDEAKQAEEQVQKMTDKYVAEVEQMIENKSSEIMTI